MNRFSNISKGFFALVLSITILASGLTSFAKDYVSNPFSDDAYFNRVMMFLDAAMNPDLKFKVNTSVLNVRAESNTNSDVLGKLEYGTVINPLGIDNDFFIIDYDGKLGYVSSEFIDLYEPVYNEEGLSNDPDDYIIIVNSLYNTLNVYYENALLREYRCATGTKGNESPVGKWEIGNKIVNPGYHGIAGGAANNPLGKRWMGIKVPGYGSGHWGIHGNINEASIGTNASQGCVRMHNDEVLDLYEIIPIGTTVIITDQDISDIDIAASYDIVIK